MLKYYENVLGEGKAVNREPIAKWALFSISCMIATLLPLLANDGFIVMKHVRVCPCSQCSHVFVKCMSYVCRMYLTIFLVAFVYLLMLSR